jgi:hypothetical protein
MKQIFHASIIILFFIGCKPMENLSSSEYEIIYLDNSNYQILNGSYHNTQAAVFDEQHLRFYGQLERNQSLIDRFFINDKKEWSNADEIKLNMINHNKLDVNVLREDTVIASKIFKGKLKNGYFQFRTRVFMLPFLPVFFLFETNKVQIGKSKNAIVVNHENKRETIVFIVPIQDYCDKWTAIYADASTILKKEKPKLPRKYKKEVIYEDMDEVSIWDQMKMVEKLRDVEPADMKEAGLLVEEFFAMHSETINKDSLFIIDLIENSGNRHSLQSLLDSIELVDFSIKFQMADLLFKVDVGSMIVANPSEISYLNFIAEVAKQKAIPYEMIDYSLIRLKLFLKENDSILITYKIKTNSSGIRILERFVEN